MFIALAVFSISLSTAKAAFAVERAFHIEEHSTINIACLRHLLAAASHHQSNLFVRSNLRIDFAYDLTVVNHQQPI